MLITDSIVSLNDGENSYDFFEMICKDSLPQGEIELTIVRTSAIKGVEIEENVIVPMLYISRTLIDDDNNPDSNGDNDDLIEVNETVEIIPLLNSSTRAMFFNTTGKLENVSSPVSIWNDVNGASGKVYNTWAYNVVNSVPQPFSLLDNITPEFDYVFDYTSTNNRQIDLNLIVTTQAENGADTRRVQGDLIYSLPINLNTVFEKEELTLTNPLNGYTFKVGDFVHINTQVEGEGSVDFYINDELIGTSNGSKYSLDWNTNDYSVDSYEVKVVLNSGGEEFEEYVTINLIENDGSPNGVEELQEARFSQLYPNPTNGTVYIKSFKSQTPFELSVYDVNGNKINSEHFDGVNDAIIQLKGSDGLYKIVLESNDGEISVHKVVKVE